MIACLIITLGELPNRDDLTTWVHLQGLDLTLPVDNSLQDCYRERQSCVQGDIVEEVNSHLFTLFKLTTQVSHLARSVSNLWQFWMSWTELPEQLEQMAFEGEL